MATRGKSSTLFFSVLWRVRKLFKPMSRVEKEKERKKVLRHYI